MASTDKAAPDAATDAAPEAPDTGKWETVGGSLGEEWDFVNGPLIGNYLGHKTVETEKVDSGEATAYQFALASDPESVVFVWGSYAITDAFADGAIKLGDLVKITAQGTREFSAVNEKTGKNEPRIVKQYRVQVRRD